MVGFIIRVFSPPKREGVYPEFHGVSLNPVVRCPVSGESEHIEVGAPALLSLAPPSLNASSHLDSIDVIVKDREGKGAVLGRLYTFCLGHSAPTEDCPMYWLSWLLTRFLGGDCIPGCEKMEFVSQSRPHPP